MRRAAALSLIVLLLLATPACAAAPRPAAQGPDHALRITPAPGPARAAPGQPIMITANGGTLREVQVTSGGVPVPGRFAPGRTSWRSSRPVVPGRAYQVRAEGMSPSGDPMAAGGRFRAARAGQTLGVRYVSPLPGETVGVGAPIIVVFDTPVHERAAVEQALRVHTSGGPVAGAWRWIDDTQVIYRPRAYWPSGTRVRLTADLAGVRAADRTYGVADHTSDFAVGRRQISHIDTRAKRMTVTVDGRVVRRIPISAGNARTLEYTTTSGTHLTMEKANPVRMVSPGRKKGDPGYYNVLIDHAVRISNSGEYVHAKNNVWAQGRVNVSHGCVNVRPDLAAWFYDRSLRGDPVVITGTNRPLEWWNGWGYWQMPWSQWREGSALPEGGLSR
ncbi:Ig-like domain-containing protein [Spongiactinospora sp. TRM90649]|uniref:L,D-transpeptidase n=1 Tax=Spongiactinospora sp. TRM90649 TaxID=3031114 RepID=UPI0023F7B706|nr:Ig-like domain-containing protein [Spongiactinospora sp. TRM90649]MDF5757766.1 Ig-like domain-containing protein [Spongiactinospora sp. TRM90649]